MAETPEQRMANLKIKKSMDKLGEAKKLREEAEERLSQLGAKAESPPETKEAPAPESVTAKVLDTQAPLIYLATNYLQSPPQWASIMKQELRKSGYLTFSPLLPVEDQFEEFEKASLVALKSKISTSVCSFLRVSEAVQLPIQNSDVIQALRAGDSRQDIDAIYFRMNYFLVRSSVIVCDLSREPYTPDLIQLLVYAKFMGIPVIGISPPGHPLNAFMQKWVKVVLTDDFNVTNVLPLIKAYIS